MTTPLEALRDARDFISAGANLDAYNWRDGQPVTDYGRHVAATLAELEAAIAAEEARLPLGHEFVQEEDSHESAGCGEELAQVGRCKCGHPRAAHEPQADTSWFRGEVDRDLVRAVVAEQHHEPRPIAWAVVCANGQVHRAAMVFAGTLALDSWSEALRVQADREGSCGPHEVVTLRADPWAARRSVAFDAVPGLLVKS